MIRTLVSASIKFRFLVVSLALAIVVLAWSQLSRASLETLPEFSPTYVEVQTEALGLSAEEVEQMVTAPLEADLLNGVQDVDVIRSQSVAGLSRIVLVFKPGIDEYVGRSRVQERLTQSAGLPQVSKPPTMLQPLSSESRLLMFSLDSDQITAIEASVIARWTVRPRLMGVPGVANVAVWGQRERQLQVQVDPARLRAKGVSLEQVVETTGNAQIVSPLTFLEASTPGTGGFIETAQQRLQVRHVFDRLATPAELGKVPVVDSKLRLSDVATIVEDHQPLIGDAIVGDQGQALLLVVEKFPGADTREVTQAVEAALEELKPGLSGMSVNATWFRALDYVDEAVGNLGFAGTFALVGLLIGLALTLLNWRSVAVAMGSIGTAVTAAAFSAHLLGQTLNLLTLAGLAIAVTFVVDDAISGNDAVLRRLAGSKPGTEGTDLVADALTASRNPLGYATAAGLLAVAPVAVMQGRPGSFFAPAVFAYAASAVASLFVAVTVAPALTSLLLPSRVPALGWRGVTARFQSSLLGRFAAAKSVLLGLTVAVAALTVLGTALGGWSLVPSFHDRNVVVSLQAAPGSSLPAMNSITRQVTSQLQAIEGVESAAAHVGRAITGDQIVDVNSSQVWVRIARGADYGTTIASIRDTVGQVPAVSGEVSTYTGQRTRDIGALPQGVAVRGQQLDVLTGSAYPLVVRVYGENSEVLAAKAKEIAAAMGSVPGLTGVQVQLPQTQDSVLITVDLDKAKDHGIKPGDVRRAEATLVQGIQVGSIFEGQKVFDVIVMGSDSTRATVDSIRSLLLDTPEDGHVRLEEVADVRIAQVPVTIERDAVARKVDVVAQVEGRAVADAATAVEAAIAGVTFPLEHHAEVLTSSAAQESGAGNVAGIGVGAVIAVFLLLQAAFRNWRLGAVAFAAVAAALSGAVVVALLTGAVLGGVLGILAVFGIGIRHVLLVYREAQELEADPAVSTAAAIATAASVRAWAVLGGLSTIALVALPFAILGAGAGLELIHSMAVTVLGGLVTTAVVAVLVVPVLYPGGRSAKPAVATPGEVA